jgi:hypothetical protein
LAGHRVTRRLTQKVRRSALSGPDRCRSDKLTGVQFAVLTSIGSGHFAETAQGFTFL